jgi:hypothetical protein
MSVDFFNSECQSTSNKKNFGLCDDSQSTPSYIDDSNGGNWIAVISNDLRLNITFTAVDHCIDIFKKMESKTNVVMVF